MWSYPVLDPVSQAYPKVQGRSPTCYSPVRHSCTPKGLTVRLACVKHAASVRPEPESNSPNKNPGTNPTESESEKFDQHQHQTGKNSHTPTRGRQDVAKNKNNKQKPPNTLLSSQTTHPTSLSGRASHPRPESRVLIVRTVGTFRSPEVFPEMPPRSAAEPRRNDLNKLRQGVERSQIACAPTAFDLRHTGLQRSLTCVKPSQRVRHRRYSACPGAPPATCRAGSRRVERPTPHCRSGCC